jgi:hypothetical protein
MVEAAVADVVGPAVAAEDPNGRFDKLVAGVVQGLELCFVREVAGLCESRGRPLPALCGSL